MSPSVDKLSQTMRRIKTKQVLLGGVAILLIVVFLKIYGSSSCGLEYLKDQSFSRVFDYCNDLGQKAIAQEGIVSDEYTLVSVHVIIRHGDRQSLHSMDNYDGIQIPCKLDKNLTEEVPEMEEYEHFMRTESNSGKRSSEKTFSNWDLFPDKEWCSPGDLTPTGAAQHVKNGLLMRKRYINKFNLVSMNDLYEQVVVRSTKWSRTYQSALALLFGFLQSYNVNKLNFETCDNTLCNQTSSEVSCNCPMVYPYMDVMSATYNQLHSDVMDSIRTRNIIKHFVEMFDISYKSVPKLSQVLDFSLVHVCHRNKLPYNKKDGSKCAQPWSVRDVYNTIQENGRKQSRTTQFQKISKLKHFPVLVEIKKRLLQQASGLIKTKFVLYSGHDTTINPLAIALNFSEGHWPPYASRIVIELYKLKTVQPQNDEDKFYLKFLFNGVSVGSEMTFCQKHIVSSSDLCPLKLFVEYVNNMIIEMGEQSYEDACKVPF